MRVDRPTIEQLRVRLANLAMSADSFEGIIVRSASIAYAAKGDLISGRGASRYGGRWNPPGINVLYGSTTPETAMAEALAHGRYFGVPVQNALPRVFVALDVRLQSVLDLTLGKVRRRLGVSEQRILSVDWRQEMRAKSVPVTHRIGRAAHDIGLEGLLVRSAARPLGMNLVVFPVHLRAESFMQILDADRLPE